MSNRRAYMKISDEMMTKLILGQTQFPDGMIRAMEYLPRYNLWKVYFTHPRLPEIPEVAHTPSSWKVGQEEQEDGQDG